MTLSQNIDQGPTQKAPHRRVAIEGPEPTLTENQLTLLFAGLPVYKIDGLHDSTRAVKYFADPEYERSERYRVGIDR